MPVIDYVFPYVSNSDPEWQKLFKSTKRDKYAAKNTWSEGDIRYRDFDTLKYFFRGLEKNMPWLNKVYMVVMSESQVPEWVNRETVNIILHKDFIPDSNRPTFNCSEIEMFMPNLPNVSEYFIWGNDDMFFLKPQKVEDWFRNGKPVYYLGYKTFMPTKAPGDWLRITAYNLNRNIFQLSLCTTCQHGPIPYRMSALKAFDKKYHDIMMKSCSHFRENFNLNQWAFADYQILNGIAINEKKNIVSTELNKEKIKHDELWKNSVLCLNDAEGACYIDDAIKHFEQLFPNKSKYEV